MVSCRLTSGQGETETDFSRAFQGETGSSFLGNSCYTSRGDNADNNNTSSFALPTSDKSGLEYSDKDGDEYSRDMPSWMNSDTVSERELQMSRASGASPDGGLSIGGGEGGRKIDIDQMYSSGIINLEAESFKQPVRLVALVTG